ncbi:MAG: PDZ domain-containing protein [Prevotellaceae bacterium]|jgi:C-terminal processing protease CtpA/Prc|nr:PDZ domain-containing protein [Prevotellaceae bacterium]
MITKRIPFILIIAMSVFCSCKKEDEEKSLAGNYRKNYDNGYYIGDFNEKGERHGQGTYFWNNGDKYEGQWLNGSRNGEGVFYWANGDKYEGSFENSKREGEGVFTFKDGSTFTCQWKDDKPTDEKSYLLWTLKPWYYWNAELGKINAADYASAEDLLNAVKRPQDKWSKIYSLTGNEKPDLMLSEGKQIGYGMGLRYDHNSQLRVAWVHRNSPAALQGIKRGWKVLSINGQDISLMPEINIDVENEGISKSFRFEYDMEVPTDGLVSERRMKLPGDTTINRPPVNSRIIELVSGKYSLQTVLYQNIYNLEADNGTRKAGYIVLRSVLKQNINEIQQSVSSLVAGGIHYLILDLRYCSGGHYATLTELAGMLLPNSANGKTFMQFTYNSEKSSSDTAYVINKTGSLNLSRIYVITTSSTANLGEYLLLGLKPYIDVVHIGTPTYGYAWLTSTWNFSETRQHKLVTVEVRNVGSQSCAGGITPDYSAFDGLDKDWGDVNERLLQRALYLIVDWIWETDVPDSFISPNVLNKSKFMEQHESCRGITEQLPQAETFPIKYFETVEN